MLGDPSKVKLPPPKKLSFHSCVLSPSDPQPPTLKGTITPSYGVGDEGPER